MEPKLRLVVDVNLWVSYAHSPYGFVCEKLSQLLANSDMAFFQNKILLEELRRVLDRP
jgi:predicted nucleic acid-binding protein